jgi:hypothetical protein
VSNQQQHITEHTLKVTDEKEEEGAPRISAETLLHLLQTHPKLAMKLIERFSENRVSL